MDLIIEESQNTDVLNIQQHTSPLVLLVLAHLGMKPDTKQLMTLLSDVIVIVERLKRIHKLKGEQKKALVLDVLKYLRCNEDFITVADQFIDASIAVANSKEFKKVTRWCFKH